MKRVLIIAAHPDDDILGCGGLIAKHRNTGIRFQVLFIAEGSSCRFAEINCEAAKAAINQRNQSALNALSLLGVNDGVLFENLPCGRLDQVPIIEINKLIENAISEFSPDTILTHSKNDANNDHRIVFNATVMATRPVNKHKVSRLLSYEVLSTSEWAFTETFCPNYFESLTQEDVDLKWSALAEYNTEVKPYPFPRSYEGVKALAMYRGMQAGCMFAEAYGIVREIQ